ncbi:MAG: SURF1 family protein [Chromatiales bacterium]|nr:MAG: SURF1 family protein [Chromatiales bacterium]
MVSRLTFRPPLWATLLLLAACALFASAGFWQLNRKAEKARLFAEFDRATAADPATTLPDDAEAATSRFRPVALGGRYDPDRQILLDSMVRDGVPGYEVLTPLRTPAGSVLVNRGWIPANADRNRLPELGVSAGDRNIVGQVAPLPQPGLRLDPAPPAPDASWPRRLLFPTAEQISSQLGYPVRDYQVLLAPDAPAGFVRDWRPAVSGPDLHLGYAVQWFSFAAAVTVIYLALNLKKRS